MTGLSFEPAEGLLRLQQDLERFFGKPFFDFGLTGANVYPGVNVFTGADGYVVHAEVPGVSPEHLTVKIEGSELTIAGERVPPAVEGATYHRRERRFGRFARTIQLPRDVDAEQCSAECRNGVLSVRVPKHAAAKPRTIAVHAT
jgi:HSP20 family protein